MGKSTNPNNPIFYVYAYLDPYKPGKYIYDEYEFDYEPFYIGKGNNGRAYDHLKGGKNKEFINKIKEIQTPVIIFYKKELTESSAHILERNIVKAVGRLNKKTGPLYNKTEAGQGCSGIIISDETRQKMSIAKKNISDETRQKMSKSQKGHKVTFETRQKIRESKKNISDETKQKMSKSQKGHKASEKTRNKLSEQRKGIKNSMYGKKHSIESRRKNSESQKGRKHSEETKQRMSKAQKGRKHSEETKRKMSDARKGEKHPMYGRKGKNNPLYGKHLTEETKRKISESMKEKHSIKHKKSLH